MNIYETPKADLSTKPIETNPNGNEVTKAMVERLVEGGKWAKWLMTLGYIFSGLLIVALLFILIPGVSSGIGFISLFTVLLAIIYIGGAWLLYKTSRILGRYHGKLKQLQQSYHMQDFIESQQFFNRYIKWLAIGLLVVFISGVAISLGAYVLLGVNYL